MRLKSGRNKKRAVDQIHGVVVALEGTRGSLLQDRNGDLNRLAPVLKVNPINETKNGPGEAIHRDFLLRAMAAIL
jgi:hypothetical protein